MIGQNNPFNIRYSKKNHWIGQKGQKRGFCEFDNLAHGVRAAYVLLTNYIRRGVDTPRKIISRYAPPSENPTQSYINYVCSSDIKGEDGPLMPDKEILTYSDLFYLMSRMVWFESNVSLSYQSLMDLVGFDNNYSFNSVKLI